MADESTGYTRSTRGRRNAQSEALALVVEAHAHSSVDDAAGDATGGADTISESAAGGSFTRHRGRPSFAESATALVAEAGPPPTGTRLRVPKRGIAGSTEPLPKRAPVVDTALYLHALSLGADASSSSTASGTARDDENASSSALNVLLEAVGAAVSAATRGDGADGFEQADDDDSGGRESGAASLMRTLSAAPSVVSVSTASPSTSQLQRSQPAEPLSAGSGATFGAVRRTGAVSLEALLAAGRGRGQADDVLTLTVMDAPVGHACVGIPALDPRNPARRGGAVGEQYVELVQHLHVLRRALQAPASTPIPPRARRDAIIISVATVLRLATNLLLSKAACCSVTAAFMDALLPGERGLSERTVRRILDRTARGLPLLRSFSHRPHPLLSLPRVQEMLQHLALRAFTGEQISALCAGGYVAMERKPRGGPRTPRRNLTQRELAIALNTWEEMIYYRWGYDVSRHADAEEAVVAAALHAGKSVSVQELDALCDTDNTPQGGSDILRYSAGMTIADGESVRDVEASIEVSAETEIAARRRRPPADAVVEHALRSGGATCAASTRARTAANSSSSSSDSSSSGGAPTTAPRREGLRGRSATYATTLALASVEECDDDDDGILGSAQSVHADDALSHPLVTLIAAPPPLRHSTEAAAAGAPISIAAPAVALPLLLPYLTEQQVFDSVRNTTVAQPGEMKSEYYKRFILAAEAALSTFAAVRETEALAASEAAASAVAAAAAAAAASASAAAASFASVAAERAAAIAAAMKAGADRATAPRPKGVRKYCLCRRPYANGDFVLQCGNCEEWYHPECIGLSVYSAADVRKLLPKQWTCNSCRAYPFAPPVRASAYAKLHPNLVASAPAAVAPAPVPPFALASAPASSVSSLSSSSSSAAAAAATIAVSSLVAEATMPLLTTTPLLIPALLSAASIAAMEASSATGFLPSMSSGVSSMTQSAYELDDEPYDVRSAGEQGSDDDDEFSDDVGSVSSGELRDLIAEARVLSPRSHRTRSAAAAAASADVATAPASASASDTATAGATAAPAHASSSAPAAAAGAGESIRPARRGAAGLLPVEGSSHQHHFSGAPSAEAVPRSTLTDTLMEIETATLKQYCGLRAWTRSEVQHALSTLGFETIMEGKTMTDRHEAVDTVAAREKFIALMSDPERRRRTVMISAASTRALARSLRRGSIISAEDQATLGIVLHTVPVLQPDGSLAQVQERPILLVVHDEMTSHAERRNRLLRQLADASNEAGRMPPKSEGPSCMCSVFLSAFGVEHAVVVSCSGAEGWWEGADMRGQTYDAVHIICGNYPAFEVCFIFDNSSGHNAGDELALVADKLNKFSGGKGTVLLRSVVRDGVTIDLNEKITAEDGTSRVRAKGLVDVYKMLTGKEEYEGKPIADYKRDELVVIVNSLREFKEEKSALARLIEDDDDLKVYGARHLSLPIVHPELNPAELLWAWLNSTTKNDRDGTRETLATLLRMILASNVTPTLSGGWFAHCDLYFLLYSFHLGGTQAMLLVRALTGHGGMGGEAFSHRKVTTVLAEGCGDLAPAVVPGLAPALEAAVDAVLPPYRAAHTTLCGGCKLESYTAAGGSLLQCHRCAAVTHAHRVCSGIVAAVVTAQWHCSSCATRVETARSRVVSQRIRDGLLKNPLTGNGSNEEEAELDHAVNTLLGSRRNSKMMERLARGQPARRRLARVMQGVEADCLAADPPFSFRALVAARPAGERGIVYWGPPTA